MALFFCFVVTSKFIYIVSLEACVYLFSDTRTVFSQKYN